MKSPEDVRREFVRDWLDKAEQDLRACRHLLIGADDLGASAAFHAQQATEKYLKGFLVWHQMEFPKTHDIARLLELIESLDKPLAAALADASSLTPYGVDYRYPGDSADVSAAEAERCLKLASDVREKVLDQIPSDMANEEDR
jgi:HEPN domain-containing protein